MNIEEIKDKGYIMLDAISGSHSYGLNNKDSDIDRRGIFKLPNSFHLSLTDPPQEVGDDKQDIKYFELKKFFKLVKDANPNILEMLFLPSDCITVCTPLMQKIIDNRNLFISKKAYYTFSSYAYSQISKATGRNKLINNPWPKDPPKKEDFCWIIPCFGHNERQEDLFKDNLFFYERDLYHLIQTCPCRPIELKRFGFDLSTFHVSSLEHVSNTYRLYSYDESAKGVFRKREATGPVSLDDFVLNRKPKGVFRGNDMLVCESIPKEDERKRFVGLLIYNKHEFEKAHIQWKQYWDWVKNRNENRWKLQSEGKLEYDQKNMMHTFRLLYSGKNILTNGSPIVRFEGEQREFLMDIRKGKYDYQTLMQMAQKEMDELKELKEKSTIPHSVNMNKINQLYQEIINA